MTREEHLAEFHRQEARLLDELIDDLAAALAAAQEWREEAVGSATLWKRKRLWDEVGRRSNEAHETWQAIRPDGGVLEYTSGHLMRLTAIRERKREG